MSECANCETESVMYRWECNGCLARFLSRLPSREARAGWIAKWRQAGKNEMADDVLEKLRAMANEHNNDR